MSFDPTRWIRLPAANAAVWICPDRPSWFVPTAAGDLLLQKFAAGGDDTSFEIASFLQRLPDPPEESYPGRDALLPGTPPLRELWLHITDRCNLACSHCLFSSGPDAGRELSFTQLVQHLDDAAAQGCRTFALTGGEPLVHPEFIPLIDHILAIAKSRIAILTNGLLLETRLQPRWPRERVHLQISLDGTEEHHDRVRGTGSFKRLEQQLIWLRKNNWRFTVSCCVTRENAEDLVWLVDYAADQGAAAIHLMWHFICGRGTYDQHVAPLRLLEPLLAAMQRAEVRGITIDNIESLKGQIFSPPGTVHDGSSAGWEAAAIGPDNRLYPSAATVGVYDLATPLECGLITGWQESPVLSLIRQTSATSLTDPWRYLLGGGDFDHSYHHRKTFSGDDPYQPLLEQLAIYLIMQTAARLPEPPGSALRLKMGELLVSCGSHGPIAVCHTNCLLSLDGSTDSRGAVGAYYATAAGDKRSEILNPVHYDGDLIEHIPAAYRFRGYGCGSPVMDAGIMPGERVVDLGCGSGVECFIAARLTGAQGRVTGIDMLEPMLDLARKGALEVSQSLGYDNLCFQKGYLEELPLPDNDADLIVSNCVLNLSGDKRLTFAEILRVLAPGGRLVAADVVCETEPDAAILNDETLRGECISGAMAQKDLVGILGESGFTGFRILKRLPYRTVNGHPFFSLTFAVNKPEQLQTESISVFYPGPAKSLLTPGGRWLLPGQSDMITPRDAELLGDLVWQLDSQGFVTNVAIAAGSNCCIPPEAQVAPAEAVIHDSGCLVCGAALVYHATEQETACHFCGKILPANACCLQGHFVCDSCHTGDTLGLIEHLCGATIETDPISLFQEIRRHPSIPLHGPQYHALVPGVLLACLRNAGQPVTGKILHAAIQRGGEVSGGSCGFMGICGAATGVGITFSVLLEATPLKSAARQTVQNIVQQVLAEIAGYEAARCCQRDCWIALRSGMRLARDLFALDLPGVEPFACSQMARNKECLGASCPLWP
jgi:MoaA/NifB/PqqE/SkfB family radical SAM enzyme/SAM-dependent methyltransferase